MLIALLLQGSIAWSQTRPGDESQAEFAARDPMAAVTAAISGRTALVRRDETHTAASRTWRIPVTIPPANPPAERCFVLSATASGIRDVTAWATVGTQQVLPNTVINASTANGVASARFCATIAPRSPLLLRVRAGAPTHWALVLTDAPVDTMTFDPRLEQATLQARERLAVALANGSNNAANASRADAGVAATRIALGGTETDFIANQIRAEYAANSQAIATIPVSRTVLHTAEEHSVRSRLSAGRCYEAIAVGTPSVTDINVRWIDSTNATVAQDTGHRNKERVRYCAQFSASFTVTATVFAGFGPIGLQLVDVGTP